MSKVNTKQDNINNQSEIKLLKAQAKRSSAFWSAKLAYQDLVTAKQNIAHSEEVLTAMHRALKLLEHSIGFSRERALLAKSTFQKAIDDLRIADTQAVSIGVPPLRLAAKGDPFETSDSNYWLDKFNDYVSLPESLCA